MRGSSSYLNRLGDRMGFAADLPPSELERAKRLAQTIHLAKGEHFLRAGEVPRRLGFNQRGLLRLYYVDRHGTERTKHFCVEGTGAASYSAFLQQQGQKRDDPRGAPGSPALHPGRCQMGRPRRGAARQRESLGRRVDFVDLFPHFGDQGIVVADGVAYAEFVSLLIHDGRIDDGTTTSGVGGGLVMYATNILHTFVVRNCEIFDTIGAHPGNNTGALSIISEPTALEGSLVTVTGTLLHDNFVALRHKHAGRVHMDAHDNVFTNNEIGLYLRMWTSDIHHNLFVGNNFGMKFETDNMNANHDYVIRSNTFYNNRYLLVAMFDQGGFVATAHIEDNIYVDEGSTSLGVLCIGGLGWAPGTNDLTSWTVENNVFFYTPATRMFRYSGPPRTADNLDFASSVEQFHGTSLFADPRFVDPEHGNFKLQSDSPAIGKGTDGITPGAYAYP